MRLDNRERHCRNASLSEHDLEREGRLSARAEIVSFRAALTVNRYIPGFRRTTPS